MRNLPALFQKKAPTLSVVTQVDNIHIDKSFGYNRLEGKPNSMTWHHVTLCCRMAGHQYSKVIIQTELEDVHQRFVPGKEYVVVILPKDECGELGLTQNQYGFYEETEIK